MSNDASSTAQMSRPAVPVEAFERTSYAFVLTNPLLKDNPIVYVNRAFERMTGYSNEMAVGRNCRFLQAGDTDQKGIKRLRAAISAREPVTVVLRNYRADGSMFLNRLMMTPLNTDEGETPYFLGVQSIAESEDDAESKVLDALSEIQHRVKNHLSMIIGMIRLQARDTVDTAGNEFETLARRVETLQLLYEEMNAANATSRDSNKDSVNLGAYLTRVSNAIAYIDGRSGVRVNIDADEYRVPMETATQLGLIVSEVMTNAMQHAFVDRDSGLVEVRFKQLSEGVLRIQVSDDGVGIPEGTEWPKKSSLGGRIVQQLTKGLKAEIAVERGLSGTIVTLDVPRELTQTE
ncbi:PAS domain-containing protein [Sulfitobacter sp. HNIBRBA3233]|uniref:sensor histidine kinase n=1 Tax=Sulfitobacter marinivivus TaxID=3158558 RepID=UPI0032DE85B6